MKPIYLEMRAFGPYAGRQVVDFRRLGDRKLLLIYGPTGSGKTTILDAMCYALYGETSGNCRTGTHMRSEYATPEEETQVSFSFAVGSKAYCVERRPEQQVAKKRGSGTKKASASAALYEIDGEGKRTDVIATKGVREKVEQLLGFKAEQFRQVVLLPQGDFRRLLLASSAERQQIMQTLFHTQRYARLQELAKQKHDAIQEEYGVLSDRIAQGLQRFNADTAGDLAAMKQRVSDESERQGRELAKAVEERQQYQQVVQEAQVLYSHWQNLKESRRQAANLAADEETFARKKEAVAAMRRAQLLIEPCRLLDNLLAQGKGAGQKAEEAKEKAREAQKRLGEARAQVEALKGQEKEMQALNDKLVRLQEMVAKVRQYGHVCRQVEQCAAARRSAEAELGRIQAEREELQKKRDALRIEAEKQPEAAAALAKAQGEIAMADVQYQREQSLEQLDAAITTGAAAQAKAVKAWEAAEEKERQARLDYESVHAVFLQGQAALLAQELKDGEPCPVCGATDHPRQAVPLEQMPSKDDVEKRKQLAEQTNRERQAAEVAMKQGEAEVQGQRRQYEELRRQYQFSMTSSQWRQRIDELRGHVAAIEKIAAKAEEARRAMAEAERRQGEVEAAEEKARAKAEQCRLDEAKAEAAQKQAEADVPRQYRQEAALQKDIQAVRKTCAAYGQLTERRQNELLAAERDSARWNEQEQVLQQHVQSLRDQYGRQLKEVREKARQAGFSDLQECLRWQQGLTALEDEEKAIKEYESKVQQVQGRISQEEKAVGQLPEPAMDVYKKRLEEMNRRCQELSEARAALALQLKQIKEAEGEISAWQDKQAALTEQYKSVGAVYELLSGQHTGINFERYVLGALLDEVLSAANLRLDKMSRRRYELQRSRSWDDKRVRRIGLDIEVFDNYTGYARPANTLSGGETFLASLSLALGLADVVQAYSGGIHLDTIFIDEGFGTLDGETLDFALKALMELKQGGRLVGIISHVPELRERIDARLAVRKTDRGSTAAFEFQ